MQTFEKSLKILQRDKRFAKLIKKYGKPDLKRGKDVFQALVRSIVYQQLSGKAAGIIYRRFQELFPGRKFPTPLEVSAMASARLRSVGLSRQKASYIHDLAKKFASNAVNYRRFSRMQSQEITEHLVQIKGVGTWTTHMLLIFTLNRLDVLPTGDLGIKKGFQIVYGLKKLPEHSTMEKLATPWRSHASVASWYLWRAADEKRGERVVRKK